VEVLRQPLHGEISGDSTELLTCLFELSYNVTKGTEYFVLIINVCHYN